MIFNESANWFLSLYIAVHFFMAHRSHVLYKGELNLNYFLQRQFYLGYNEKHSFDLSVFCWFVVSFYAINYQVSIN
jgi:hypothetical protein